VPIAIISRTQIGRRQHLISFGYLFEFFFSRLVAGIFVWMIGECEAAISLFEFLFVGVALNAKDFVIVSFPAQISVLGFL
jgi:hypothetical protein